MTKKLKSDLLKVGELIVRGESSCICDATGINNIYSYEWQKTNEAQLIRPTIKTDYWWGIETMGEPFYFDSCRQARLIGIAMMLTMPKEMYR